MATKNLMIGLLNLLAGPALAETFRLAATRDNSIVMVDGEWSSNAGQNGRIRIKGNQHIVAIDFDVAKISGRRVMRAELVCQASQEMISGVTISTIAASWDEMKSTGLTAGLARFDGWGYGGARFPAVTGGNGFTLLHQAKSNVRDRAYHWEVPADMVHALATVVAFRLAIHEQDADYGRNPTIFAREQAGKQPYLRVEVADERDADPAPPTDLKLLLVDGSNARLTLQAPKNWTDWED